MPEVTQTVRGLGDGIKFFFDPFFNALNADITDETLKDHLSREREEDLNAAFSAGVRTSFKENLRCREGDDLLLGHGHGEVVDVVGDRPLPLDPVTLDRVREIAGRLDPDRRAAMLRAVGLDDAVVRAPDRPWDAGRPAVLSPLDLAATPCFAVKGTEPFKASGLQSFETGFMLQATAAMIGVNIKYGAKITIVGEEPEIVDVTGPVPVREGFVPPARRFSGKLVGTRQISEGGGCGDGTCVDEWVSGVAQITILFGMKAQVVANVPKKLKDALPGLGVEAGLTGEVPFTFPFLHYPGTKPDNVPDGIDDGRPRPQ